MEIDDENEINEIEKKINYLEEIFCKTIYDDVENGIIVDIDDLLECLKYFTDKEEFEKCIILKKHIKK